MMQVHWSVPAFQDLESIYRRIQEDNPEAARKTIKTIYTSCTELRLFPNRGRASRLQGRRELVFQGLPYLAVYQIKEYAVEISRIYHTAQNWRP